MKKVKEIAIEYKGIASLDVGAIEAYNKFIASYENDIRQGVRSLCLKAKKQIYLIKTEQERLKGLSCFEQKYSNGLLLAGVDEAGRGPLAGPVVAAAVILNEDITIYQGINDSKKISDIKRRELYNIIVKNAISYGVGIVGPDEIDEINILRATHKAMKKAILSLDVEPKILLVDGLIIPDVSIRQEAIIKGDARSISIAAASIIAKVTRDDMMIKYDKIFEGYGLASHKGYGTRAHYEAIKEKGILPIHRKSFL